MNVSDLLENVLNKINEEIVSLLESPDNEEIIGNDIEDELSIENYVDKSQEYLVAIRKLVTNGVTVKPFLEKSLIVLTKLPTINSEIVVEEDYRIIGVTSEVLKKIYLNNEQINNCFLDRSKVLIIQKTHNNLEEFCSQIYGESETSLLYLLKGCLDNFIYIPEEGIHRLILLPNCTDSDIQMFKDNKNELLSYLKLNMLSAGMTFHKHHVLDSSINAQSFTYDNTKVYSQYNEILYILSEYNHSNDLLNKYFLLYTIIENFMYRKPIATMLRTANEFSIRDFKSFYSKINNGELDKLGSLFYEILDIDYNGNSLVDKVVNDLNTFKDTDTNSELINFLLKIGVSNNNLSYDLLLNNGNNYKNFKGNGRKDIGYFPKIVYQLRNTILHNTATEFHLTHYELSKNEIIVNFLKDFMIPILEKIILHLIIENHEIISYKENSLILYKLD